MKVGITFNGQRGMGDIVARHADHLEDVWFHSADLLPVLQGDGAADEQAYSVRLHEFLSQVKGIGVPLVLAHDAICVEDEEETANLNETLDDLLRFYRDAYGVHAVSLASPVLARAMKRALPDVRVYCSANMFLGEVAQIDQVREFADLIVLDRDVNRDLSLLEEIRRRFGRPIRLLANEGCIFRCVDRIHHLNRLSHLGASNHGPLPCAGDYGRDAALLLRSPIIRPEDVKQYEGLADSIQLDTRAAANESVESILEAYASGTYAGGLSDLVACPGVRAVRQGQDGEEAAAPPELKNGLIPDDYFEKVTTCRNACDACTFCDEIARVALDT